MKKLLWIFFITSVAFAAEFSDSTSTVDSLTVPSTLDSHSSAVMAVDVVTANNAKVDSEIALRDSLLALRDSIYATDTKALQLKLDVESAKCANWEKSYSTLEQDFSTCSKMLRVTVESQEKQAEQAKKASKVNAMAQSTAFIGGTLMGILIGWLIWD